MASAEDVRIWPCGRYEVYAGEERLNGFHTRDEAVACAAHFSDLADVIVLDRADKFVWSADVKLIHNQEESA